VSSVTLLPEGEQQRLGRYQLVGEIASGGMASVFLARLGGVAGFQRFVAIKRLHPHLANEPEFVEMFLDEARLAASIHHRNVVPILEIGTTSGGYYLVMEFIEGRTLARLMTQAAVLRETVPRDALLRIVLDTLSGLHAAHEQVDDDGKPMGVVHRDCSPQNILVGQDGCSRITDFGIARATARLHSTREGAMKGKLAYMAPEQTQGEGFDRRADLFSVAVVLWEVLAARRLFKSNTEAQTLRRLLHDPIPRLGDAIDIHPALDALCHKGLARDPNDRFQTAEEMADALEHAAKVAGGDGAVANQRAVESLMKERYGEDVTAQREAMRSWLHATPTMVGPRGPVTDRGWLGPTASSAGLGDPSPATKRGWLAPDSLDELALESDDALSGAEPRVSSSRISSSRISSPPTWDAPEAAEDETSIYDPPSTTGMTGATTVGARRAPATVRSAELAVVPAGGASARWVLVGLVVIGLGAVAFLAVRGSTPATSAPSTVVESHADPSAAPPAPADTAETSAAPSSAEPSAAPRPRAKTPRPSGAATAPPVRPPPVPPPSVAPSPPVKPPPVTPPKAPPGDLDDLANPYR
jgi:serine/threonine-protein kinase